MTWRTVNARTLRTIQFGLLGMSTIWGLDYLLPPPDPSHILNYIEQHSILSLEVWGAIMVALGVLGLGSELLCKRYRQLWIGVWIAHTLFVGIFIALSFGSFVGITIGNEGISGFRTPFTWLFIGGLHIVFAQRPEPFPELLSPEVIDAVKDKLDDT